MNKKFKAQTMPETLIMIDHKLLLLVFINIFVLVPQSVYGNPATKTDPVPEIPIPNEITIKVDDQEESVRIAMIGDEDHQISLYDEQFLEFLKSSNRKPTKIFLEALWNINLERSTWFTMRNLPVPDPGYTNYTRENVRKFLTERSFHADVKSDALYNIIEYCRQNGIELFGIDASSLNSKYKKGPVQYMLERLNRYTNETWAEGILENISNISADEYVILYGGIKHGQVMKYKGIIPELNVWQYTEDGWILPEKYNKKRDPCNI